jgi:hypothetical protein
MWRFAIDFFEKPDEMKLGKIGFVSNAGKVNIVSIVVVNE